LICVYFTLLANSTLLRHAMWCWAIGREKICTMLHVQQCCFGKVPLGTATNFSQICSRGASKQIAVLMINLSVATNLNHVLPYFIKVLVQDGIHFIRYFPNHPTRLVLLKVRSEVFLCYWPS
jgi:hypothetical protein